MKIAIRRSNWNTLLAYCKSAYKQFKTEIGGMAVCVNRGEYWEICNPVILKQRVTASNTHLDKKALAKYYTEAHGEWSKEDYRFLWWHTHPNFGATWSGTDLATIQECKDSDLSFSIVLNMKEEYQLTASIWKPFEAHVDFELNFIEDTHPDVDQEVKDLCEEEQLCLKNGWGHTINDGYTHRQQSQAWGQYNRYNYQTHMFKDDDIKAKLAELDETVDVTSDDADALEWIHDNLDEAMILYTQLTWTEKDLKSFINKVNKLSKANNFPFKIHTPANLQDEAIYNVDALQYIQAFPKNNKKAEEILKSRLIEQGEIPWTVN